MIRFFSCWSRDTFLRCPPIVSKPSWIWGLSFLSTLLLEMFFCSVKAQISSLYVSLCTDLRMTRLAYESSSGVLAILHRCQPLHSCEWAFELALNEWAMWISNAIDLRSAFQEEKRLKRSAVRCPSSMRVAKFVTWGRISSSISGFTNSNVPCVSWWVEMGLCRKSGPVNHCVSASWNVDTDLVAISAGFWFVGAKCHCSGTLLWRIRCTLLGTYTKKHLVSLNM